MLPMREILRAVMDRAASTGSALAIWAVLLASFASPDARSQARYCEAVTTGRAELVEFTSLLGNGDRVRVMGVLQSPAGDGKFPALLMLHGHGGVLPARCYGPAMDSFTNWGYVTLLIDSESQTDQAGTQLTEYTTTEQAHHTRAAAAFLALLPNVSAARIGLVGWSTGGLSAIKAIASPELQERSDAPIRAAVGIYPICPTNNARLHAPLLILIGGKDTVTPASSCQRLKDAVLTDNLELVIYPNAGHGFDAPSFSTYRPSEREDAFERIRRHFETNLAAE